VPHGQATVLPDISDGPAVAVFDPVGAGEAKPAVIGAGDDHISDTRLIAIGQPHLRGCYCAVKAMAAGSTVEFGDQVAGGGEHDRVEPSCPVGKPCVERILGGGGEVADMDPAVIKVEVERPRVAVAEGERGCRLGGVGEAMQFGQPEGAVGVADVAQHAAGADRAELLIITDQPDTRTPFESELDGGVQGEGVGHAGFINDHHCGRADRGRSVGQVAVAR